MNPKYDPDYEKDIDAEKYKWGGGYNTTTTTTTTEVEDDPVNHPTHYTSSDACCSECGTPIECIDITEHMGFNLGNAVKYAWRCDLKNDDIEDLKKAIWYLQREISKRERKNNGKDESVAA